MRKEKLGFTLIELSIVLVVIALLAGGIVFGKALLAQAKLQSIIINVDRFKKAAQLFRQKYQALPGDMANATTFWGADATCNATAANITPKPATCNGDGNGIIGDTTSTPLATSLGTTALNEYESYRAWQQLANAGFVEGAYTGTLSSETASNNLDPAMNVPAGRIAGSAYTLSYAQPIIVPSATTNFYGGNYRHIIVFGLPVSPFATPYTAALSTADALSIDQKVDDGKPGTGNVLSFTPALAATANCATTAAESTATYNTAVTGVQCSLIFITGF